MKKLKLVERKSEVLIYLIDELYGSVGEIGYFMEATLLDENSEY